MILRSKGIGFGVFLVIAGVIWTLVSLGVITWSVFGSLSSLWPLILVVIGINMIFSRNIILRIATWVLFIATVVVYGHYFVDKGEISKQNDSNIIESEKISWEKMDTTQNGELKMSVGASEFNIGQTDKMLIDGNFNKSIFNYDIKYSNNDTARIELNTIKKFIKKHDGLYDNLDLRLNKDIVWDIKMEAGASSGTIDMTDLKVKNLDMDVGASTGSFDLKFGNKYKDTNVKIDTGLSSFNIDIPNETGVKIKFDGGLNSTNLDNGLWIKDGKYYMNENYESKEAKIYMDVDMGVGSFNVNIQK